MSRNNRNKAKACPNCGTALQQDFEFCPHCGQENHDLRVPFRTFLYEFIESVTHFDAKLWATIKVIFTRPGLLTKDFVEGKRARYVNPARFYIFLSFIFFALLTWKLDRDMERGIEGVVEGSEQELRRATLRSVLSDDQAEELRWKNVEPFLTRVRIPIDSPYYRPTAERLRVADPLVVDSLLGVCGEELDDSILGTKAALKGALMALPMADSLPVGYSVRMNGIPFSFTKREEERLFRRGDATEAELLKILGEDADSLNWIERRAILSAAHLGTDSSQGRRQLLHNVTKAMSVVMFILMPFTAVLLLWIFYRKRYYWEHLIFSVHTHAIFFLFFSVFLTLALIIPGEWPGWLSLLIAVGCVIYLLASLKRVYGRSWSITILRFGIMSVPYLLVFAVLMLAGLAWGFFTL